MKSKQSDRLNECNAPAKREAPGSASVSPAAQAKRRARAGSKFAKDERTASPCLTSGVARARQARRLRSQGYALLMGCVTILLLFTTAYAQEVQSLPPNTLIERELTSTQTHLYRIPLKAGQFVHFDVFQKSIDVVMTLTAPDGKTIEAINVTPFGLREMVSYVARVSGDYELKIETADTPNIRGPYQLQAEVKNAATSIDKKRIQAEGLMIQYRREIVARKQLKMAQQARTLWAELGERWWEGFALLGIGGNYYELKEPEKAAAALEQSLAIMREVKSRAGEALILRRYGAYYEYIGQQENATSFYDQARPIEIETGNPTRAYQDLRSPLSQQFQSERYEEVVETFTRILEVARVTKDRATEADTLNQLGLVVGMRLGKIAKAQEYYEQAFAIAVEIGDKRLEPVTQSNLAQLIMQTGKFEKALEYAENARRLAAANKALAIEGGIIRASLVPIYRALGRKEKVREALERALVVFREANDADNELSILYHLSILNSGTTPDPKELAYLEQFLKIHQEKYPTREQPLIEIYSALADYHYNTDNPTKAIEYCEKALAIIRKFNLRSVEPHFLRGLGVYYRKSKQYDKAIELHERALQLLREWPGEKTNFSRAQDALFFVSLMKDWKEAGNAETAIYYGKIGINGLQEARGTLRQASNQPGLQQELQQSFINGNEQHYRDLADVLISQARLPEAEQVLRMLKEEEYFEYIRGDSDTPKGEKATLTPKEEAADKRYREVADKLAGLGAERSALLNKPARTPEEEQRLAKIEADLAVAGQSFQKFLDQLSNELKTTKDAGKVSGLRDSQGMMEDLRELGNGAVALYTVVGEDTFSIVLTTADVQKAYQVPIKAADLNRKVLAFREALQNPMLNPLPLAQELYKILLAPVEKDLRAAKAQILMWSLDGVLRYVPMAALHDGEKYLVERYRHAVFTPASNARLHFAPSKNWRALGLGVTKAHGENIPALPGVAEEMRGIIKTENGSGVLPGTIKLDEQFTQESMLAGLRERNNVVHIASHFQFQPGNETNSALLLGDGNLLSLAEIKTWQNPFGGVELLTLSACNTATGGSGANGKEIEGFGVLAQLKGARAVIASLWPVADRSTMHLMQEFYQLREAKDGSTKAEALGQAQGRMLRGELSVTGLSAARSIVHETDQTANKPRFKVDPKAPFAHPYYWAPFILIGNWK